MAKVKFFQFKNYLEKETEVGLHLLDIRKVTQGGSIAKELLAEDCREGLVSVSVEYRFHGSYNRFFMTKEKAEMLMKHLCEIHNMPD